MNLLIVLFTPMAALLIVLLAVCGLLVAGKRDWKLGFVRIGATVLSLVLALPLARLLAGLLTDGAYTLLQESLGTVIRDFLTEIPIGLEGMRMLVSFLVAPILFLLLFALFRALCTIPVSILGRLVPAWYKKNKVWAARTLGAVNGVLIAVIALIPLCGFMMVGGESLGVIADTGMVSSEFVQSIMPDSMQRSEEEVRALSQKMVKDPVVFAVHGTVGKPVFSMLTSGKLQTTAQGGDAEDEATVARPMPNPVVLASGTGRMPTVVYLTEVETDGETVTMDLASELRHLLQTTGTVVKAIDVIRSGEFEEADKDVLFDAVDSVLVSDSRWVELLAGDTLKKFSDSWLEGQEFLGLKRPALDDTIDPVLDCILTLVSEDTGEELVEDMHIVTDVVGDLLVYDVLDANADYGELVVRLGQDDLLSVLLGKLESSPRLQVLAGEIRTLGVRMVTRMLDVDRLLVGEHEELMIKAAEILTDAMHKDEAERLVLIREGLSELFDEYGYTVSESVALEVADMLIADLGGDGVITADELTDYLVSLSKGEVELPDDFHPEDVIPGGAV